MKIILESNGPRDSVCRFHDSVWRGGLPVRRRINRLFGVWHVGIRIRKLGKNGFFRAFSWLSLP